MITQQPPPNSFGWTADVLARILAGIDWAMHQQIVMVILVAGFFVGLIQYAMGSQS